MWFVRELRKSKAWCSGWSVSQNLTWISSSEICCWSSAIAAMLSASLSLTAITSSLLCRKQTRELSGDNLAKKSILFFKTLQILTTIALQRFAPEVQSCGAQFVPCIQSQLVSSWFLAVACLDLCFVLSVSACAPAESDSPAPLDAAGCCESDSAHLKNKSGLFYVNDWWFRIKKLKPYVAFSTTSLFQFLCCIQR